MDLGAKGGSTQNGRSAGLVLGVLAAGLLALVFGPSATAQGLEPCDSGSLPKPGSYEGTLSLPVAKSLKRYLSAEDMRLRMISPASRPTGEPEFPVRSVRRKDGVTRIAFGGGIYLTRKGVDRLAIQELSLTLRSGKRRVLRADVGASRINLLLLRGTRVRKTTGPGAELEISGGRAVLTRVAGRLLSKRLLSSGLRPGITWTRPDLFATQVTNPVADPPPVPPPFTRPDDARGLTWAEIEWRPRESFIQYIASGDGTAASGGAMEGTPESRPGKPDLVYSFTFPFSSGWESGDRAAVNGSGTVGFRHCRHTINFTVTDPEIELDGSTSRLVFRIEGTDGTAFSGSRAVVLNLDPTAPGVLDETSGSTRNIQGIPARVPAEATGIFAGLYLPSDPFGEVNVTYGWGPSG